MSALPFKIWIAWQKLLAVLGRTARRVDPARTPPVSADSPGALEPAKTGQAPPCRRTKRVFFDLP